MRNRGKEEDFRYRQWREEWGRWFVLLVALPVEHGLWTLVSPVTITVLILFVSGIPMLEEKYEGDPEFEAYRRRTGAFFPMPPKASEEDA